MGPLFIFVLIAFVIGVFFFFALNKKKDRRQPAGPDKSRIELRTRLMEEFPEHLEVERDLKGELTDEEITKSIAELKDEERH